jgi:hypothetical protein
MSGSTGDGDAPPSPPEPAPPVPDGIPGRVGSGDEGSARLTPRTSPGHWRARAERLRAPRSETRAPPPEMSKPGGLAQHPACRLCLPQATVFLPKAEQAVRPPWESQCKPSPQHGSRTICPLSSHLGVLPALGLPL